MILTILNFFAQGPTDTAAFVSRQDKERVRRPLMRLKAFKARINDE